MLFMKLRLFLILSLGFMFSCLAFQDSKTATTDSLATYFSCVQRLSNLYFYGIGEYRPFLDKRFIYENSDALEDTFLYRDQRNKLFLLQKGTINIVAKYKFISSSYGFVAINELFMVDKEGKAVFSVSNFGDSLLTCSFFDNEKGCIEYMKRLPMGEAERYWSIGIDYLPRLVEILKADFKGSHSYNFSFMNGYPVFYLFERYEKPFKRAK